MIVKNTLKNHILITILWILRGVFLCTLFIGMSQPYIKKLEKISETRTTNILILLDISRSMLAEDMAPNRIGAAKKTVETFIQERAGDMFGLIVFAGKPFLTLPFSTDTQGILRLLRNITPDLIHQEKDGLSGTNIGDALLLGNMTLSGMTENSAIILITDGKANIGINPRIVLEESTVKKIPIYTIGIGGASGSTLFYTDPQTHQKVYFYDENGDALKNDIDENLLKDIAEYTHGEYFHAKNTEELIKRLDNINRNTKKPTQEKIEFTTIPLSGICFIIGCFLLCAIWIYEKIIWKHFFYH